MSRNPYHGADSSRVLRSSVFAFIDFLGYTDLIKRAEREGRQQELFGEIYDAISDGRNFLEDKHEGVLQIKEMLPKDFYVLKAFTDNIVIGWPIRSDAEVELGQAVSKLMNFQFSMSIRGFFVRGAISIGNAFIDDIAVFGDALTAAYAGEAKLARDPRIVLTEKSVAATKHHLTYYGDPKHAPQASDLLCDADGQWFVNYLESVMIAVDEVGPFYEEFAKHKDAVEVKLKMYASDPVVFQKYAWVANYHNFFCDLHSRYFSEEHRIDQKLFDVRMSSILAEK